MTNNTAANLRATKTRRKSDSNTIGIWIVGISAAIVLVVVLALPLATAPPPFQSPPPTFPQNGWWARQWATPMRRLQSRPGKISSVPPVASGHPPLSHNLGSDTSRRAKSDGIPPIPTVHPRTGCRDGRPGKPLCQRPRRLLAVSQSSIPSPRSGATWLYN